MRMKGRERTTVTFRQSLAIKPEGVCVGNTLAVPISWYSDVHPFSNSVTLNEGVKVNDQDFIEGKVAIVDGQEGHRTSLHLIDPDLIDNITVKKIMIFV